MYNIEHRAEMDAENVMKNIKDLMKNPDNNIDEIMEMPLEVSFRSNWHNYGEDLKPEEYKILITTGGPAIQITGDLDEFNTPVSATLEYTDWMKTWEKLPLTEDEDKILLDFVNIIIPS